MAKVDARARGEGKAREKITRARGEGKAREKITTGRLQIKNGGQFSNS